MSQASHFFILNVAKNEDTAAIRPKMTPTMLFVPKLPMLTYDWKKSGRCGVTKIPQMKKTPTKMSNAPMVAVMYLIIISAGLCRYTDYEDAFFSIASSPTVLS